MPKAGLSATEWVVLCLLAESPAHGWTLVRTLEPDGELGRVWAVPRPQVYRALDSLTARGLIEPLRVEGSRQGPRRTVMRITRSGRTRVKRWLREPVEHVRDARWLLLTKLLLCERSELDPRPLLEAQQAALRPIEAGLAARARSASGSERMLVSFRLESARAVRRFVERQLKLTPSSR